MPSPVHPIDPDATRPPVAAVNDTTLEHTPAEVAASPSAPRSLDLPGYSVERELGRGGTGVVYQARQLRPSRPVALKMVLVGRTRQPRATAAVLG